MTYFIGIDGGGSSLRVVVVNENMEVIAQQSGGTANPGIIGHDASAQLLRNTIRAALSEISPDDITGVGIGVAGASAVHSSQWLYEVVRDVTPHAHIVPSSDFEIALVGANGERQGLLLLSGTGSIAYGINEQGKSAQAGGWGYLLGDEGSGYWIGLQAIKLVTRAADGLIMPTNFTKQILTTLELEKPSDLIAWLYRSETPRTRDIATLAPVVLDSVIHDLSAAQIVSTAAHHLSQMASVVIQRLKMQKPKIAFAGGLLESDNPLSQQVCRLLELPSLPVPRYPPVIGAALLAKITEKP